MRKLLLTFLGAALFSHAAMAQVSLSVPNDTGTGTTVGKLAKLLTSGSNSTAIITATTDTTLIAGIVVGTTGTSGTTGNAIIAQTGKASCIVDAGGVTAGQSLVNSTVTAGDCMAGPGHTPMEVVGFALATVASGAVDVEVIPRRLPIVNTLTPVIVTGTGNIDLSSTNVNTVCGAGINYTGSTATLTVLATAQPGCVVPITTVTGLVTVAAAGSGTLQTSCTTPRTRAAGSTITLWVLSNAGSAPIINVYGDCG